MDYGMININVVTENSISEIFFKSTFRQGGGLKRRVGTETEISEETPLLTLTPSSINER